MYENKWYFVVSDKVFGRFNTLTQAVQAAETHVCKLTKADDLRALLAAIVPGFYHVHWINSPTAPACVIGRKRTLMENGHLQAMKDISLQEDLRRSLSEFTPQPS